MTSGGTQIKTLLVHENRAFRGQNQDNDDGYQEYVGDWLKINKEKFPNGLEPIVKKIKEKGLIPGIWIAPFLVEKNSSIFKEHPEWILKKGVKNWSGAYSLNFELEEVRDYIRKVFNYYKDLGFEFFEID